MEINKLDLLTVAVLSVIFFSIAAWNIGIAQAPNTTWQATGNESFHIDLGKVEHVSAVYFLVKNGSASGTVSTGLPQNWSKSGVFTLQGYYVWSKFDVNRDAQYVKFDFQQGPIEIAEMAVLGIDDKKLAISMVASEGSSDQNLVKLTDEQALVTLPPTYLSETFFDEIYFVRTAEQYLRLQVPHPPLGKLIIASGIAAFGYSPFGWRIMGVIFATLMIPLIFFLGKKLFGTWIGGFASAFLLSFDFMHFTMARMATADTYVVFFSLASQLFFLIYLSNVLKDGWKTSVLPLFLAVMFFALGFSTKWLVLYGFLGQLAFLLSIRLKEVAKLKKGLSAKASAVLDHPFAVAFWFLIVAGLVYFLTYIPDMLASRSLVDVISLQFSMFNYHATLSAVHPFSSPWWTWPLMLKPLWLSASYLPGSVTSTIVLMGNPAVWWVGFAFLIGATGFAVKRKDFACIFIAVLFLFQWLPYVFISRVTFIYHFYVNVPLLCLASAYFLSKYWSSRWGKAAAMAYFAVVVALFWLFYPSISGMPTSTSSIDSLKWLGSWVF